MTKESSKQNRFWKKVRRVSIRSILGLILILGLLFAYISNSAVKEARSVDRFQSNEVKGQIKEFRPNYLSQFTPKLIQNWFGEKYFRTVHSAHVFVYLDPNKRRSYHREQSPQLAIDCLSNFTNLDYLDLGIEGEEPKSKLDFTPLKKLRKLNQVSIGRVTDSVLQDLATNLSANVFEFSACEISPDLVLKISENNNPAHLSFNFCQIPTQSIRNLNRIESLRSVHFFSHRSIQEPDGTYRFEEEIPTGGFAGPSLNIESFQAYLWLQNELPGIGISGFPTRAQVDSFWKSNSQ